MEYLLRLLCTGLAAWRRPRLDLFDESVVAMRVWPTDLDVYGHMNNGRYLTVMDLGRTDLLIRSGLVVEAFRRGWGPLLGGATIRYRRSLTPLRRYQLRTKIVGWDDKWFYVRQQFTRGDEVMATALVKGLLRGKDGNVSPTEAFALVGGPDQAPDLPPEIVRWIEAEAAMCGYEGTT
jgi:acyl-CoA thioesterase FadM